MAEPGWGRYFHFTYETFPKGTLLPTFSAELAARSADALKRVDEFFATKLGTDPAGRRAGQQTVPKSVEVAAGKHGRGRPNWKARPPSPRSRSR